LDCSRLPFDERKVANNVAVGPVASLLKFTIFVFRGLWLLELLLNYSVMGLLVMSPVVLPVVLIVVVPTAMPAAMMTYVIFIIVMTSVVSPVMSSVMTSVMTSLMTSVMTPVMTCLMIPVTTIVGSSCRTR
jgi:hypothetical protein